MKIEIDLENMRPITLIEYVLWPYLVVKELSRALRDACCKGSERGTCVID